MSPQEKLYKIYTKIKYKLQMYSLQLHCGPGPATQLAKGYASLLKKMLRKGLFSIFLYVLNTGKKGPFLRIVISLDKRVFY